MARVATHLADKSAIARWHYPEVGARLEELRDAGRIATCSIIELEVLFSARSRNEFRSLRVDRQLVYPRIPIDQLVLDRAEEVQALLAEGGQHRVVPIPDLVIAAAAELAGVAVLHYDADFDVIAKVTKQPVEWVVSRGSVP